MLIKKELAEIRPAVPEKDVPEGCFRCYAGGKAAEKVRARACSMVL